MIYTSGNTFSHSLLHFKLITNEVKAEMYTSYNISTHLLLYFHLKIKEINAIIYTYNKRRQCHDLHQW